MKCRTLPTLRRGAAIVAAVALLAVVVITLSAAMRQVTSSQQQLRHDRWKLQAMYLAESAVDRARTQVARNRDYLGETWKPVISGPGAIVERGNVTIEIERSPDENSYLCQVTAVFPNQPVHRAQVRIRRPIRNRSNNE